MKNYLGVCLLLIFTSCYSYSSKRLGHTQIALDLLTKDEISETAADKYFDFPFYTYGELIYDPVEFSEWWMRYNTNFKEVVNIEDFQVLSTYDNVNTNSSELRKRVSNAKLDRVLKLVDGEVEGLEIIYNNKLYYEQGYTLKILYKESNDKIIAILF